MATIAGTSTLLASSPTRITKSFRGSRVTNIPQFSKQAANFGSIRNRSCRAVVAVAMNEVSATGDVGQVEVTWQIIVGAVAGVTPFVVAGIEFSKRIIAQRRCQACGGSGLVLEDKEYFRCPECGGFLPWQSWKRFFSG